MDQYMEENYLSTYFLESYAEIELMIDELNISFMESSGFHETPFNETPIGETEWYDRESDAGFKKKIYKILSKIEKVINDLLDKIRTFIKKIKYKVSPYSKQVKKIKYDIPALKKQVEKEYEALKKLSNVDILLNKNPEFVQLDINKLKTQVSKPYDEKDLSEKVLDYDRSIEQDVKGLYRKLTYYISELERFTGNYLKEINSLKRKKTTKVNSDNLQTLNRVVLVSSKLFDKWRILSWDLHDYVYMFKE